MTSPPAFQWAMAWVVEMLTPVQPALLWYAKSVPRIAGVFMPLLAYQLTSVGLSFQLASCCPDKTWLPYWLYR